MYINDLNTYLKEKYGHKVYKLSLNGGMTCPNRDGTIGTGGCIFCSAGGSGDFAADRTKSITQQIEDAKILVRNKISGGTYIAYFQAYTNTYAPTEYLRKIFTEAVMHPDIEILSVATRPDCLDEEKITLLSQLNQIKPVWVELGLQTMHERTADYIRRGYPLRVYEDAVCRLKAAGLTVITHVILGLPYETEQEMKQTVSYVGQSGVDGIKLQLLHVIRGTDLEREYLSGKFEVLTMEAYVKLVADCLELIPPQMVVHRLTGDGDKRTLVAPMWSADKKRVLNALNAELRKRESLT